MKPFIKTLFLFETLLFAFSAVAQHRHEMVMKAMCNPKNSDTLRIAVLLYPQVVLQDFAGPIEVFSKAKKLTHGKYKVFTVGLTKEEISTENGIVEIVPDYNIKNMPEADYLFIPGASMPVINQMLNNEALKEFIIHWNLKKEKTIVSVCTGAYLLANTGLLNHKKATTHYFVADDFSRLFPLVWIVKDVRFVDEGALISSSGITSGIDVALYIVGQNSGKKIRVMIARAMQYDYHVQKTWPVAPNGMKYRRK